jgi:hypothetical protein
MTRKLTKKQSNFVQNYLTNGMNATQAAMDAGYKGNRVTLASIGYENLRKPQIAKLIKKELDEMAMGPEEVKARLSALAVPVDVIKYYSYQEVDSKQGKRMQLVVDLDGIERDGLGTRIKKIFDTAWGTSIEWHDPANALDKLNKVHGAYTENIKAELNHTVLILDIAKIEGSE